MALLARTLPPEVLQEIIELLSPQERHAVVPLVCKAWLAAVHPQRSNAFLFKDLVVASPAMLASGARPVRTPLGDDSLACYIRAWLLDRRPWVERLTVDVSPGPTGRGEVAAWASAFGRALPALAQEPASGAGNPGACAEAASNEPGDVEAPAGVRVLTIVGPGELILSDVPWAASLRPLVDLCPSGTASTVTTTTHTFDDGAPLDGGAAEAWEALGALLGKLPCLEVLDLSYTHAMTYLDPARGAAAAPWPALTALKHLSLAHDLSVQPPPPAPEWTWRPAAGATVSACGAASEVVGAGGAGPSSVGHARQAAQLPASYAAACNGTAAEQLAHLSLGSEESEDETQTLEPLLQQEFDSSLLTVDAAHAAVELLTWLPRCAALVTLDLRGCGLEAVPLAVVHLRQLQRLDLQDNPLVSLRLPGPLESLTWLRLSTDPCYDMLYNMTAAEVGEAVAVDEMMVAELPTPALEELEVDSTSDRALDAVAQAAAGLAALRRMVLANPHTGVTSSRVVQAALL
eukprot:XP_001691912.1 predicted protein [Chlamydomonas reinhardtii]